MSAPYGDREPSGCGCLIAFLLAIAVFAAAARTARALGEWAADFLANL